MILDPDFLTKTAIRHAQTLGYLPMIAVQQERFRPEIAQINRLWDMLPQNAKDDRDLQSRIRHVDDKTFRGALGELLTHCLLRRYGSIIFHPQIKDQTPDFYLQTDSHSIVIESVSLGQDETEREQYRLIELFRREVREIRAKFFLSLVAPPIPNPSGNLHGIGAAIARMLRSPLPTPEPTGRDEDEQHPTYWVEHNGARAGFHLTAHDQEGPIYIGANLGLRIGDTKAAMLRETIRKKLKKYDFPFSISVVVDSFAELRTLLHTMIGREQIPVDIYPSGAIRPNNQIFNTDDGIWGSRNSRFKKNLMLQSVIFVRKIYQGDSGFKAYTHLIENPHIRTGLGRVFHDIPDVLRTSWGSDGNGPPGLIIQP